MIAVEIPDFCVEQIANSGQCFRINRLGTENIWRVVAFGASLLVEKLENSHVFHCSREEYENVWVDYFDVRRNYGAIKKNILKLKDPYLSAAIAYGSGIRILRQDLWEVVVSFIISQRNSIVRIKNTIEKLCSPYGNDFPSPLILAKYDEKMLASIGLGYRSKYLLHIARAVDSGKFDMKYLRNLNCREAIDYMKQFSGIGDKVANCIALYGLHKLDAFPVDTWIARTVERQYGGNFSTENFPAYAGVVQQYMFFFRRHLGKSVHRQ
ncbi:MAG: hypothetical protein LBI56_01520 [Puniceicoccales bacterium]|jgi:N-glycosylase/DNA lyase|nr:hypothetical protein [Puniceicoccales bacterium]